MQTKAYSAYGSSFFTLFLGLIFFLAVHKSYAQGSALHVVKFTTATTYLGGYHIKCHGQSSGTITANPTFGRRPYTYLWSTGDTSKQINNKPAGVYIVTATDSVMVSQTDTIELLQPNALNAQAELNNYNGYNIRTHGDTGFAGILVNGGTPPYSFLWANGNTHGKRTDLTVGTYTFTVADANQCSTSGSATLTEPDPIQFSFSGVENPHCFKSYDGKASLNLSGGIGDFSVIWENGNFSLSPDDLQGGYNAVRIYENGDAIVDTGITLTEPDASDIQFVYSDYNGFNVSCVDCFNGSVTSSVTGGTAPYTYLWDDINASTTANLSNLNGGEYTLNITDANGCKSNNTAQLTMPAPKDWSRYGNANIDTAQFIGSTDSSSVVFKSNNQEALRLAGNGNVGIGITNPTEKLEVNGTIKAQGLKISNFEFKLEPASALLPEILVIGRKDIIPIGNIMPRTCLDPLNADRINLFDGAAVFKLQSITPGGSDCKNYDPSFYVGLNGCNGVLEVDESNGNSQLPNKLLLNTFCGKDVLVGKSTSGNLIANYRLGVGVAAPVESFEVIGNALISGNLGLGLTTPQYKLDVSGEVNATNFLKDGIELRGSQWSEATNSIDNICYTAGNVGIGTCDPAYQLHLKGEAIIALENPNGTTPDKFLIQSANGSARLISNNAISLFIDSDNDEDNSSIPYTEYFRISKNAGSNSGVEKDLFYINGDGTGYISELYVQQPLSCGGNCYPDYVFDDKYNLMSLADFSKFIKKEKHLPGIQTAKDFTKENKGLAVSDMLLKLLKTQEEQALYIVQLHEQNELLKKKIELLLNK